VARGAQVAVVGLARVCAPMDGVCVCVFRSLLLSHSLCACVSLSHIDIPMGTLHLYALRRHDLQRSASSIPVLLLPTLPFSMIGQCMVYSTGPTKESCLNLVYFKLQPRSV
jgi:hypothetical protein